MGVGKSFRDSMTVHNGKHGGLDSPAKKKIERFSQSQKPDSNGKKGQKGSQQKFGMVQTPAPPV